MILAAVDAGIGGLQADDIVTGLHAHPLHEIGLYLSVEVQTDTEAQLVIDDGCKGIVLCVTCQLMNVDILCLAVDGCDSSFPTADVIVRPCFAAHNCLAGQHQTGARAQEGIAEITMVHQHQVSFFRSLVLHLVDNLDLAGAKYGTDGTAQDQVGTEEVAFPHEMNSDPKYWKKYYQGTEAEIEYKKLYSYSDRCRYYLPAASITAAIDTLLANTPHVPQALICQYFPRQYEKVLSGQLADSGEALLLDRICDWYDVYATACKVPLER